MIDRKAPAHELALLIEQRVDQIADSWARTAEQNASIYSGGVQFTAFPDAMLVGLQAMSDALKTDSYAALKEYLVQICAACLRRGFENRIVIEWLLLSKDAILSILERETLEFSGGWTILRELDRCLRWMIHYFNTLYENEANQHLRVQHQHIVRMLKIAATDPDALDMDEVLRQVAEGIMAAVDVGHCDFYVIDEIQGCLIPKCGISHFPRSTSEMQYFLNHPPDRSNDAFGRALLELKEPLVSYDAQNDPRFDRKAVETTGTRAVLAVPLIMNDRLFAVAVTGTFDEYRTFTEEQIELARDVAGVASLVLENARLNQQNRQMAALEERERLAREIHDNLAQTLGILKMQASYVDGLFRSGKIEQAQTFLDRLNRTAADGYDDAREAIFALRSGVSSPSEFLPAFRAYIERFSSAYGIAVRLVVQGESKHELQTRMVVELTRVIQEALTNVRKHANARTVMIRLDYEDSQFSVTVEDDGKGFSLARASANTYEGVGIQIMRERVESLGGLLHIDSTVGKGTRVAARIPWSSRK